ncbi:hypothetical protein ABT107_37400, partial [Streptomyces sp. NPDC002082]
MVVRRRAVRAPGAGWQTRSTAPSTGGAGRGPDGPPCGAPGPARRARGAVRARERAAAASDDHSEQEKEINFSNWTEYMDTSEDEKS